MAAPASATVTSTYSTDPDGTLTATSDGADPISITCEGGFTKVNGADPVRTPIAGTTTGCAGPKAIVVNGGPGDNAINLAGVTKASFTGLTDTPTPVVTVNAGDGNDTVTGTEVSDTTNGGTGNDRLVAAKGVLDAMNGQEGDDVLVWNNGEGNDTMNGGEGKDTIENNGSDAGATVNETYIAETIPGGYKFSRTSAGAFVLDVFNAESYVNNMFSGDDSFDQSQTAPVGGIAVTINAGVGNDTVNGTDGNDVANGEAGNDTLAAKKGNDTMNGGDNDDRMIWDPGEGSDVMEGGAGTDVAVDNGGGVAENFIVSANGQRVTATRDSQAPFFLDIGTTETLDLNTAAGDDTVTVNKGLAALIKVDVDLGADNDTIRARNDSAQVINGGDGIDSARVDKTDTLTAVEKISGLDRKAPKLKLAAKRLKLKNGTVAFKVSCPKGETFCKGTVKVFNAKKKVVGSKKVTVKGGKSKSVKVKLAKAARQRIKAQGTFKYRVRFSAKDASGNGAAIAKTFTLRA